MKRGRFWLITGLLLIAAALCLIGYNMPDACRYMGSLYQDDPVICAHNYRRHFGSFGALRTGSTVKFTDLDGNLFEYTITEIEMLAPTQVDANITSCAQHTSF